MFGTVFGTEVATATKPNANTRNITMATPYTALGLLSMRPTHTAASPAIGESTAYEAVRILP